MSFQHRKKSKRGYDVCEVVSALQKCIRRGDARHAGYWALELFESGYAKWLWRRLLTISAEDCWGIVTYEIEALYRSWLVVSPNCRRKGIIFPAKAAVLLAQARKCRDADHLINIVYDAGQIDDESLAADLEAVADAVPPIPDAAYDCHTPKGRAAGKTKRDFLRDEYDALQPRLPGLFDDDVERYTR